MNQSQIKFAMAAYATWLVLRNPVLTNVYLDKWQNLPSRPTSKDGEVLTLYGFIFHEMYDAA